VAGGDGRRTYLKERAVVIIDLERELAAGHQKDVLGHTVVTSQSSHIC
jgi:hypothetical protein